MAARRATAALVALLLGLGSGFGCATRRHPTPVPKIPPLLPTVAELREYLAAERARVHSLRIYADSEIAGPDGTFRASELLLVEPPNHLRIEVLSAFGVAWILATNGKVLDVYSRQEDTVYRGRPTRDIIDYYLPVPVPLEDLTELLLGRPPPRVVVRDEGVAWEAETGLVRLVLRLRDQGAQTMWFDHGSGLLTRCEERDANDGLRYDLQIKAYRHVDGATLASDLTIVTQTSVRVRLAYAKHQLNPELPVTLFELPYIVGAREEPLDHGVP